MPWYPATGNLPFSPAHGGLPICNSLGKPSSPRRQEHLSARSVAFTFSAGSVHYR